MNEYSDTWLALTILLHLQEEAIYKRQEKQKKNLYLRNKRILQTLMIMQAARKIIIK